MDGLAGGDGGVGELARRHQARRLQRHRAARQGAGQRVGEGETDQKLKYNLTIDQNHIWRNYFVNSSIQWYGTLHINVIRTPNKNSIADLAAYTGVSEQRQAKPRLRERELSLVAPHRPARVSQTHLVEQIQYS